MISTVMYDSSFYEAELVRHTDALVAALKVNNIVEIERLLGWIEVTEQYLAEAKKAGF